MEEGRRWIVVAVVAVAIVALVLFARGTPDHGDPGMSPSAAVTSEA
jgi:hypothetical protein